MDEGDGIIPTPPNELPDVPDSIPPIKRTKVDAAALATDDEIVEVIVLTQATDVAKGRVKSDPPGSGMPPPGIATAAVTEWGYDVNGDPKLYMPMHPGYTETVGMNKRDLLFIFEESKIHVKLIKSVMADDDDSPSTRRWIRLNMMQCQELMDDMQTILQGAEGLMVGEPVEYRGMYSGEVHCVFEEDSKMCHLRTYYKKKGEWCRTHTGVCMYGEELSRVMQLIEMTLPLMKLPTKRVLNSKWAC